MYIFDLSKKRILNLKKKCVKTSKKLFYWIFSKKIFFNLFITFDREFE